MKHEPTRGFFFRHLHDGRSLREHPLTWLAVGAAAGSLPATLLVRAIHDRLRGLVRQVCAGPAFASNAERAERLQAIFERHILGGEHWSSLSAELFVSRRQFFRERKFLCDELAALLQLGPQMPVAADPAPPSRGLLLYNEAHLAFDAGNLDSAERILADLSACLPAGDLHSKALTLAAECAMDRLRFDAAAAGCERAVDAVAALPSVDDRTIGSVRINLARSRYYLLLSDYRRANAEIASALRELSRLASPDARRFELTKALLVRAAEVAINVGDFDAALEHVRALKYASGPIDAACDVALDLASVESATETAAGRFQSSLVLLNDAYARAEHLGLNRQIVKLAIERAWVESTIDAGRGVALAARVDALAEALHVPWLTLEAALFSAVNAAPAAAWRHASKARAACPPHSMSAARATLAQALACFSLGRIADALDLAADGERVSDRLDNNRMRACSLALSARIRLATRDRRTAIALKRNAEELLRLYGTASERSTFAEWTQTTS